jgi:hypothetical protein
MNRKRKDQHRRSVETLGLAGHGGETFIGISLEPDLTGRAGAPCEAAYNHTYLVAGDL